MKRVVIVRSNGVDPDSRVEKIANSLMKNGYAVTLLVWDRSADHRIKKDKKQLMNFNVDRIGIGAKAQFGAGKKSLIPFIKFQCQIFFWLIKNRKKYDICHLCDFDTAFTGSLVCRLFKKKFVFDIFDYLSTNPKSGFRKLIKRLEDSVINAADAVIICTEQRKEQISGTNPRNLTVIHNSPEKLFTFKPMLKSESDKIKICYVGILQEHRLLKEMIDCISSIPDVELHIGGFGLLEEQIKDKAEKNDNIFFYGKLLYNETLSLESQCDVLTAVYEPTIGNHQYAAPNKFYESLMFGKPVIMVKGTGMSDVVEQKKLGVVIDYSYDGFRNGVLKLISEIDSWKDIGNRMKQIYETDFSWQEMETRLFNLYAVLLGKE